MYIDFEDRRPDTPRVERALSAREGVLISIIIHLLLFIGLLFMPDLPKTPTAVRRRDEQERAVAAVRRVQPRVEVRSHKTRADVDASSGFRVRRHRAAAGPAETRFRLPANSSDARKQRYVKSWCRRRNVCGAGAQERGSEGQMLRTTVAVMRNSLKTSIDACAQDGEKGSRGNRQRGRNLQRSDSTTIDNPQGKGDARAHSIDSKGSIRPGRRFVAQGSEWFGPQAAMIM